MFYLLPLRYSLDANIKIKLSTGIPVLKFVIARRKLLVPRHYSGNIGKFAVPGHVAGQHLARQPITANCSPLSCYKLLISFVNAASLISTSA